jgi:radial spoke head protein 3
MTSKAAESKSSTAYTFQQPPQRMGASQPQYRDPAGGASKRVSGNIMHDRRVVRGNTYAAQVMSMSTQSELNRAEREAGDRKKQALRQSQTNGTRDAGMTKRSTTPDAVEGRKHMDIQTEQYLEELTDAIEEVTQETQTDPMLDRPPTPVYVPFKVGRDMETQIQDGDLFHFDTEVDPILDVMVGKTLEQAMLEVMQEEEIELLRQQQLEFEQRRKEEILEAQRLEAAEKRKFEEKERRKKQEVARIQREKETREKLRARQFAKAYLTNLENRVFSRLQDEGWFRDNVAHDVELEFYPWLMQQVDKELDRNRKARALTDELIRRAVEQTLEGTA